jgi:hypothetical protein
VNRLTATWRTRSEVTRSNDVYVPVLKLGSPLTAAPDLWLNQIRDSVVSVRVNAKPARSGQPKLHPP